MPQEENASQLITTVNVQYFKSRNVHVFPASFRGYSDQENLQFDPEARLYTEANFINAGKNNPLDNNYIIGYSWSDEANKLLKIRCVIGGYYFEINDVNLTELITDNLRPKWLYTLTRAIELKDATVTGDDAARTTYVLKGSTSDYLDAKIDSQWAFTGITIAEEEPTNAAGKLQLVEIKLDNPSEFAIHQTVSTTNYYIDINLSKVIPAIEAGHAEHAVQLGNNTQAIGASSIAAGNSTDALGNNSIAVGYGTTAIGDYSIASGKNTYESNIDTNAVKFTIVDVDFNDHTLTVNEVVSVDNLRIGQVLECQIDERYNKIYYFRVISIDAENKKIEVNSADLRAVQIASPDGTTLLNKTLSIAVGVAYNYAHTEGINGTAIGEGSHAEGEQVIASGYCSHAEGDSTNAVGKSSHTEGYETKASGVTSHAEGDHTVASGLSSHAEGKEAKASGQEAHAEGCNTEASGVWSHSEGHITEASGDRSHAEGWNSKSKADYSHAEGHETIASGNGSHAEGEKVEAYGEISHAEGDSTRAKGKASHAEGAETIASGNGSHTEGYKTKVYVMYGHAEGEETEVNAKSAHAEGRKTIAYGEVSHTEGISNTAKGTGAHAEGASTDANGNSSHTEGYDTQTDSIAAYAHAEGKQTYAKNEAAHAEGEKSKADGSFSHAEGTETTSGGSSSHAEGHKTKSNGRYSHAEGSQTVAIGESSHTEGISTRTNNKGSHAEGYATKANANYTHAEGNGTSADGVSAHAEGSYTKAIGEASHAEGNSTEARGDYSLAAGEVTKASGTSSMAIGNRTEAGSAYSFAAGQYTKAADIGEFTCGQYNNSATLGTSIKRLFTVGNGTDKVKKNAFEVINANGKTQVRIDEQNISDYIQDIFDANNIVSTIESTIINTVFPVGSIYTSTEIATDDSNNKICPIQKQFPTTKWERIEGKFLYAAEKDGTYIAGAYGGNKKAKLISHLHTASISPHSHTLTVDKAGSHWHPFYWDMINRGTKIDSDLFFTYGTGPKKGTVIYGTKGDGKVSWYVADKENSNNNWTDGTDTNVSWSHSHGGNWDKIMDCSGLHNHKVSCSSERPNVSVAYSVGIDQQYANGKATGISQEDANMPPYLCVYMWKRTA